MKAEATRPPTEKTESVLLVDDEQALLQIFKEALEPYFEVATATSTKEAEFLLHKRPFSVVVSDHQIPGGNGMSFLVRCREEFPRMQRILVTGFMKPEMLLRGVNEAALYRYLLKPIQVFDLVKIVGDAIKARDSGKTS